MIGPVVSPPYQAVWNLTCAYKQLLYGKALIQAGGRYDGPGEVDEERLLTMRPRQMRKRRLMARRLLSRERMICRSLVFHCLPYMCWESLVPSMGLLAVIHLPCADVSLALARVKHGMPVLRRYLHNLSHGAAQSMLAH